jgi:ATP-binding cassette subfamily G (WHITE) protein 2 (SNQ2)
LQPDALSNCMMCPYSEANSYLASLNISPDDKWRNLGIFLVFVATNYMLVYSFLVTYPPSAFEGQLT